MTESEQETLKRWRLILGSGEADGTGVSLTGADAGKDAALTALYEFERKKKFDYKADRGPGGSEKSQPAIARWLGDIRKYFPQAVVKVMQQDALKLPELKRKLLLEPEILEQTTPDVHLVATLMELGKLIPPGTRETARRVVRQVVDELLQKLELKLVQAVTGALNRSVRNRHPKHREMDWNATILKNLKHYQPAYKTVVPEVLIGFGRKNRRPVKDIVLCLDQSGSMASSIVYSGIFGSVLASVPTLKTRLIAFDTEVADLTEDLKDPVDLLFGVQLGGGTDIAKALRYCRDIIPNPADTILVLISDLFEGGDARQMRRQVIGLADAGVQLIVLLALNDDGSPAYDHQNAHFFAQQGIPVFACTPDLFPDLMAAAIGKQDLNQWVGEQGVPLKGLG
jgi:hypothetical protein